MFIHIAVNLKWYTNIKNIKSGCVKFLQILKKKLTFYFI